MKRLRQIAIISLLFCGFFMLQCNNTSPNTGDKYLFKVLKKADSIKFINYEKSDSLLEIANSIIIKNKPSNLELSHYYFLRIYTSIFKEDYSAAINYSDSAKQVLSHSPDQELSDRLNLAMAVINELLNDYDKAIRLYNESYSSLSETKHHFEKEIALFGLARIRKNCKNNYHSYLNTVDSIVAEFPSLKNGFYWDQMAYFKLSLHDKMECYQKAIEHYGNDGNTKKKIEVYIGILSDFLNAGKNDSIQYYLNIINHEFEVNPKNLCFEFSKAKLSTVKAFYYARIGKLNQATKEADLGIKNARKNKQNYFLKLLYSLKSDMAFNHGECDKSRNFLEQSQKYEIRHLSALSKDKINAAEYQFRLKQATLDIVTLQSGNQIKNLTLIILIISIFISLLITYIIYLQREKISHAYNEIRKSYKSEKIKSATNYGVITSIHETVKDNTLSYAKTHKQVQRLLNVNNDIDSISNLIFNDLELKQKIYKTFPGIIESQFKFIVCIYYDFDSKTTMKLLAIKKESLKSRKKRLSIRIGVPKNQSLREFIIDNLK